MAEIIKRKSVSPQMVFDAHRLPLDIRNAYDRLTNYSGTLPKELTLEDVHHLSGVAAAQTQISYYSELMGDRRSRQNQKQIAEERKDARKYARKLSVRLGGSYQKLRFKLYKLKEKLRLILVV